jgi:hypothetical protein
VARTRASPRDLGPLGDQVDHRHQQHQPDLEEHRESDQCSHEGHRPRQRAARGAAHDRVDDLVGAAGVGEQLGEDRAQRDQDPDAGGGVTEPAGEGVHDVEQVLARHRADGQAADDQGQERVELQQGDQEDQNGDPGQGGRDQLPAGRDGLGQVGDVQPELWRHLRPPARHR